MSAAGRRARGLNSTNLAGSTSRRPAGSGAPPLTRSTHHALAAWGRPRRRGPPAGPGAEGGGRSTLSARLNSPARQPVLQKHRASGSE
eukprot:7959384-Alexandrium_andersonii.AAC.1